MIILLTIGHAYHYELEKFCRLYYPFEKIVVKEGLDESDASSRLIETVYKREDNVTNLSVNIRFDGMTSAHQAIINNCCDDYKDECERTLAVLLMDCFAEFTGYRPPWGILTGVRPAKLMRRLALSMGNDGAENWFADKMRVSAEKIDLCRRTCAAEELITSMTEAVSFSLYIAIPFCPSRCSYCSFVSHSIERAGDLINNYVNLLCEEIKLTGEIAGKLCLKLETIYIGGGTPTTLTAEQLSVVMETINESFDLKDLREYTVEAGRPDTITLEKLEVIKNGGATRISINPQTMNDSVLEAVGRRHTARETVDAFYLARKAGFSSINMDLIAGLPSDNPESFRNTLDKIIALSPESVTIHTLAMKRAARLSGNEETPGSENWDMTGEMVRLGEESLTKAGIYPYYMYRQSKTTGNLENVGYAKKGHEGFYNVYIMDETHTILACGASGVTKLREPGGDYIERIFNYKYPYEYISRFDEMRRRKNGVIHFYERYGKINDSKVD